MSAQLRLCRNNQVTRTFVWVVSSRQPACNTVSINESSWCNYEARRPDYHGSFSILFRQSLLLIDFDFTSILMCLSIWLTFNKLMDTNLHNRLLPCSKKNFENNKLQCDSYIRSQPFCIRTSNLIPYKALRTILSCHSPIPLFENLKTSKMDTRNLSSKAGKISIGEKQSWEMLVDVRKLSPLERKIHERHRNAVRVRHMYVI